jgi:STE24 endopeptidase
MPFLLMLLLTLVCLPDRHIWESMPPLVPSPFGPDSDVAWSALLTGLATALVGLNAFRISRGVARPLKRDPNLRERVLPRYERARFFHQFVLFSALGLSLCVFGWGWAVSQFWQYGDFGVLPCPELLVIAPFLVGMVLSWVFFYDAERASHQAVQTFDLDPLARTLLDPKELEVHLQSQQPHRDFGGRWAYVLFQLRQKLALVLLPVGLLLAQKEMQLRLSDALGEYWQLTISLFGCACVMLAFIALPWGFRLALGLKPLPAGPLRDRLLAASQRLGFRCSNILLWNTRSGMGNAMVVGLVPWVRYVVFTDRLVEDFSPEEVEAVFGHEVGHVKHQHMIFYLGFLSLSMVVLFILANLVTAQFLPGQRELEAIALIVGLAVYVPVVFGFVSRRCEGQADVYGCRAVSCTSPDCLEHHDGVLLAHRGRGLCPTGIRTFVRALEKVALINGINRDRPGFWQSWQHSTIAKRVAFLQRLLVDPGAERAFQRRVALVKWGLVVTLSLILVVLLLAHRTITAT